MPYSEEAAVFRRGLAEALDAFRADGPSREAGRKRLFRLDLGVIAAYCFALLPVLPQLPAASRGWDAADWMVNLHLAALLLFAIAIQLRICVLDRRDRKESAALAELADRADRLCVDYRRAVRGKAAEVPPGEKRLFDSLNAALRRGREGQATALRLASLKRALLLPALLLLAICYASFLVPLYAEGVVWTAADWTSSLLLTALAVALLYGESVAWVSVHETLLLQEALGRCRIELGIAEKKLAEAEQADSPSN